MKRKLFHICFAGLAFQILTALPIGAQVDVDPSEDEPGRIVFKNINGLGQAALKAVAAGDYGMLKPLTAYGLEQREWVIMGNEFLERIEAKAKAELKNAKGEEADGIRRKVARMKEQFNDNKVDEAMKRVQSKEKEYGEAFKKLKDNGIRTTVYWMPIHEYAAYRKFAKKSNVVNTAKTYDEILALPLFPNISKKHQDAVIKVIKSS